MERCYFSFADMVATNDAGYFPYTPPTPLLHGLRASLDLLLAEGLPQVYARHHRLAEGVRRGVAALGLELCATDPVWESDTVSAIRVPERRRQQRRGAHRLRAATARRSVAGLSKVAGQVFRIGHLGDCNEVMCLTALAAAEISLHDAGAKVELGAGVAAAQTLLQRASLSESLAERGGRDEPHPAPAAPGAGSSAASWPCPAPTRSSSRRPPPSAADYVFLDLEDAVAPSEKEQARKNVIAALHDIDWRGLGKTVSVRINGLDTHYMYRDVVDVMEQAGDRVDTLLVPKVGRARRPLRRRGPGQPDRAGQGLRHPGRPPRR